jgi:hypothetical protein
VTDDDDYELACNTYVRTENQDRLRMKLVPEFNSRLTFQSPVVTIRSTRFRIQKPYILPTECIYVFRLIAATKIISLQRINRLV